LGVAVSFQVCGEERLIDLLEKLGLVGKLLLNRATRENVLQIAPLLLNLEPFFESGGQEGKVLLYALGFSTHDLNKSISENHVDVSETFIKVLIHIILTAKDEHIVALFVALSHELNSLPQVLKILQLTGEFSLTSSFDRLSDDLLHVLHDVHIDKILESKSFFMNVEIVANHLADLNPMTFLKIVVSQGHDNGHSLLELFNILLKSLLDGIGVKSTLETLANLGIVL